MKKWFRSTQVCEHRKFVPLLLGGNVYLLMDDGTTIKRSRIWLAINKRTFIPMD